MVKITIMIDSNEITINQSAAPTKVEQKNKKFFIVMGNNVKTSWVEFVSDNRNTAINKLNHLITNRKDLTYTYTLLTQDENGVMWSPGSDWDIDGNNI